MKRFTKKSIHITVTVAPLSVFMNNMYKKFCTLQLMRRILRQSFEVLKRNEWDER